MRAIGCHCHGSAAAHRAQGVDWAAHFDLISQGYGPPREPVCGQCSHDPEVHKDGPGVGCAAVGCLCLNTPALVAR